jgi:hypothetical protein
MIMKLNLALMDESYKHSVPGEIPDYSKTTIELNCVKNSFASFQVLLEVDQSCDISLTDAPSFSIHPDNPQLRIAASIDGFGSMDIKMVTPIADDNGVLQWDCIENGDYYHLEKNSISNLWCEIQVPSDAVAGQFSGTLKIYSHRLFENEEIISQYDFKLTVHGVTLPAPLDYKFHLDLWQHLSNIARKHDITLFSEEHFKVIENYVKSLAHLGQKNITVIATEIPWSGQRTFNDLDEPTDLFEYSYIKTIKSSDGSFVYDYSVMDRYIELCIHHGIRSRIEVFGLCGIWMTEENGYGKAAPDFPDGVRVRYLDSETGCYKYMNCEIQIRDFIHSLYTHFIEKKWLELVRITADEPADLEIYRKTIKIILEEGPLFKFSIAINKAEFTTEFDSVMSDATPSLKCLAQDYDFIKKNLINRNDKTVSWYVCCRPHFPNTFLKSNLLESRLICLLTYYLGLDGFLRWNYTVWPEKPRERLIFRSPEWLAGDMNFVYPGNDGNPLLSLRYKALLRGIEDFELLSMADEVSETTRKYIMDIILKGTSLHKLSDLGYDETMPVPPFSLSTFDYDNLRNVLYKFLS